MKKAQWRAVAALLVLVLTGCGWQPQPIWPITLVPHTSTPNATAIPADGLATPTVVPTGTPTPETPEAEAQDEYRVCTGYERGALNVRACPGTECAVRFILAEGARVFPAGERARVGESTWVRLENPPGWVNARYVCREGIP